MTIIPTNTLVIVPITCSCSNNLYQHNATYELQTRTEAYFTVANNTYQGLTTCQALMSQNRYNYRNLSVGMRINVPLRCACPTRNQTQAGFRYLLSYLITWRDSISDIAGRFSESGVDDRSILIANELSDSDIVFPFTPLLVPLQSQPIHVDLSPSPPPPPSPVVVLSPEVPSGESNSSRRRWVFVGVGVGVGLLIIFVFSGFLVWFFRSRRRRGGPKPELVDYAAVPDHRGKSWSTGGSEQVQGSDIVSPEGVRLAIGSLAVYQFDELQKATNSFDESNRIKGSVYKASLNGDNAAVKMMKGDVTSEISILKQINHSHIIRLSGFCVHHGNTYLVYEYAEKGSLRDWLDVKKTTLAWKERVQIAYDIADALNYLHNYTNPPYIHKNLKSSNVLLDLNMRGKIANFGLARTLENDDDNSDNSGMHLTKHVVGTYGYMAPEYIENGLVTTKLDIFAFGVVLLEILSGKEATSKSEGKEEEMLCVTINDVVRGENVREKLGNFMDPCLKDYPLDLAYTMAELANKCVAHDLNSRPDTAEIFMTLSKILSSSLDWDPSDEIEHSRSLSHGR